MTEERDRERDSGRERKPTQVACDVVHISHHHTKQTKTNPTECKTKIQLTSLALFVLNVVLPFVLCVY